MIQIFDNKMPVCLKNNNNKKASCNLDGEKNQFWKASVAKEISDLSSEISYAVATLWHFVLPTTVTELFQTMKTISFCGPQFKNNLSGSWKFETTSKLS